MIIIAGFVAVDTMTSGQPNYGTVLLLGLLGLIVIIFKDSFASIITGEFVISDSMQWMVAGSVAIAVFGGYIFSEVKQGFQQPMKSIGLAFVFALVGFAVAFALMKGAAFLLNAIHGTKSGGQQGEQINGFNYMHNVVQYAMIRMQMLL